VVPVVESQEHQDTVRSGVEGLIPEYMRYIVYTCLHNHPNHPNPRIYYTADGKSM